MRLSSLAIGAFLLLPGVAYAQGAEPEPLPKMQWSFDGPFGTYDRASEQRGLQVWQEVCSSCHSMKEAYYRNLTGIGLSADQVKAFAAGVTVSGSTDDSGQPIERPALPADHFRSPFPNDKAARAANNGALPPDHSLIVKAREGGSTYIASLLQGYRDPPAGMKIGDGMNYNIYFEGRQIAMAPPLHDGQVTYSDGTAATVEQMSHDVATFLTYMSNPEMEQRKRIGVRIVLFLAGMTVVTYAVKRKDLVGIALAAMDSVQPVIGIIGGSGLYDIDGLEDKVWRHVPTPWGEPSDQLLFGSLDGVQCVFLPRHGRGHRVSPSHLNYRANIDALKRSGVTDVLSLSAVGSLKEELAPGHFVIVDQFIDRSFAREKSFFGQGCVAHVSVADPVCPRLGDVLHEAAEGLGLPVSRGGTYLVMEGPQFSTKAESQLYRSWGCSVIGMTNMPEAKLAREAELCYATVAMVTDFDCWHPDHGHVTVDQIVSVMSSNADKARQLVRAVVPTLGRPRGLCPAGCDRVLDFAISTPVAARDPELMSRLDAVAGRVLVPAAMG